MEFSSKGDKDLLFRETPYLTSGLEGEIMTIAQQLREEGIQKGIQKGVQQGEATILKRQLEWRFGKLSSKYLQQLDSADPSTLLHWSKQILEAATIEEVFA